ncbi:YcdB/YcdC domain-containing protein [Paenibacillus thermoaerophilus]|uniref:YcdB/YcdC domain-containing protein n=1 Tax=Paenibacillus thermoaerophilus TaxID=1215385 RepID=A0ABW2V144_9BACL|nr:YcdB/YcdC domain-containing protein [Paenibacillus thermoaerophilus]
MKRRKKTWGLLGLSAAMVLSMAPMQAFASEPVSAVAKKAGAEEIDPSMVAVSQEKAAELAKAAVEIPEGFKLRGSRLSSHYMSESPVWTLEFARIAEDRQTGSISVAIDAHTGSLVEFSVYDEEDRKPQTYPPKVDYAQAKAIADEALAKYAGDKAKLVRYDSSYEASMRPPLDGNVNYSIRYNRYENGYPYEPNGVSIQVNGNGKITRFSVQWTDDVEFSAKAPKISEADALKIVREKFVPSLVYFVPWNVPRSSQKMQVVYQAAPLSIDAVTGEPIGSSAGSNPLAGKPLTETPAGKPPVQKKLSQSEAVERVKSLIPLPEGVVLQNANYNEYSPDSSDKLQATWSINWLVENSEAAKLGKVGIYASIDAMTGIVRNYHNDFSYWNMKDENPAPSEYKLTVEQAEQKAVDLVKKNLPHLTHELYPNPSASSGANAEDTRNVRFGFVRAVHGILSTLETVNVTVDRYTGEILEFYYNPADLEYPKTAPKVIGVDQAKELLLQQYELRLHYVPSSVASGLDPKKRALMIAAGEIPPTEGANKAALVYELVEKPLGEYVVLDAVSGEWRNGESYAPTSLEKPKATDLEGHWAARELQLMLDYKAVEAKDGLVRPDESITRGEMIKMLVIAMNGGYYGGMFVYDRAASFNDVAKSSPYFGFVERAVDMRLLDPSVGKLDPEGKITREEIAQMIVRALRYDKLAERSNLFALNAADMGDIQHKGHVAIVLGLGIMSLNDDGKFLPSAEVSRAAAATAFYRYLEQRSQLQDQPGYYY